MPGFPPTVAPACCTTAFTVHSKKPLSDKGADYKLKMEYVNCDQYQRQFRFHFNISDTATLHRGR